MNNKSFSLTRCGNRGSSKTKRMILLSLLLACLTTLSVPVSAASDGFIWINVSIKVIVDPATGDVPATMNDALLRQSFDDMNRWLANTWRGYRVRAADLDANQNFKRIGNASSFPNKWYLTDLKSDDAARLEFEKAAKANKTLYGWSDSAVNIYFNNSGGYSAASFPWSGQDVVVSAYQLLTGDADPGQTFTRSYKVAGNLLHEIGHYFGLPHTFSDDIADTAPDPVVADARNETAVRDGIAQFAFKKSYSALTSAQRTLVDNTANNVMAYYQLFYDDPAQNKVLTETERFGPARFIFTEQQMDQWANYANKERAVATNGRTRFVSPVGADGNDGLTHTAPKRTVLSAVNSSSAGGSDIVLLRPGNYNESLTLNKPVTLRATRAGSVTIGQP